MLLVGLRGLGAEVAKNLILAGVRALTMLDHHQVGAFWGEKQGNRGLWGHLNELLGKKNVFFWGGKGAVLTQFWVTPKGGDHFILGHPNSHPKNALWGGGTLHFGSPTGRTSSIWGHPNPLLPETLFWGKFLHFGVPQGGNHSILGAQECFLLPRIPIFLPPGLYLLRVTPKCPYFSPCRCPLRTHGRSSWSLLALWGAIGPRHRWRGHRTSTPWWMSRLTPRTSRANLKLSSPNSML